MNGVDTIRSREETTSISCYEYESVHHSNAKLTKKRERERGRKKEEKDFLPLNLILQLDDRISMCVYLKENNFYFENRFDIIRKEL
jgi:hypothetical protein